MKKLLFILLLLPCFILEGYGQSFALDKETSVEDHWGIWMDNSKPDTTRLNAIHNYIWIKHLFVQPDSAYLIATEQIEFSRLKGNKNGEADGLNLKGISFAFRGNNEEAISYYDSALVIFLEIGNNTGITITYNNLGVANSKLGDNSSAINYLNKSLTLAEATGNKQREYACLNNLGNIYYDLNELGKALSFFQRSLVLGKETNIKNSVMLSNIGLIYTRQKKFEDAIKIFDEAMKIAEENNNLRNIVIIQKNKGNLYLNSKDTAAALVNLKKSLINYEKIGNLEGSVIPLVKIGKIFHNRGISDSAEIYSILALERTDKSHSIESFADAAEFRYLILKQKGKHEQALQFGVLRISHFG